MAAAHPRHLVLAAFAAGLALGAPAPGLLFPVLAFLGWAGRRPGLGLAVALAGAAGAVAAQERLAALERTSLTPLLGHVIREEATLLEPARTGRFGRASALVRLRGEPVLLRGPAAARWARARPGARLRVRGTLRAPDHFARNRAAHAVLRAAAVVVTGSRRGGVVGHVDAARRAIEDVLGRGMPPAQSGLLRGMVLGQDHALPDSVREDFRASGLSHLVAASGQNVMLLAALGLAVAAAVGLGLQARLAIVLVLIAIYVPLAGAGPSIQRAGVMGAVGVMAAMAGRPSSRWYALLLAAAVTLAIDPRAPADPGWQMSFAAVIAIVALCPRWMSALEQRGVPAGLAQALALAAAATLATAPIVAWHFDRVSLVSLPANVLAAPAVAPIMWLGMIAAVAGQVVPAAADLLLAAVAHPLGYMTWLAHVAARAPGATAAVSPWAVLAASGVILGGAGGSRRTRRAAVALAVLVVAAWAVTRPSPLAPPDRLRVTFLDIGQGDATLVQDRHAAVLVDTGPAEGGVVGLLRAAGVRRLDLLVLTHAQADHLGAAAAVLRALPVGLVLDGRDGVPSPQGDAFAAEARRRLVPVVAADAGQVLRAGRLEMRVLHPRGEPAAAHAGRDPNERAVVTHVRHGRFDALLPADAESGVLASLDLPEVELLKVSHHGSADAGLPAVLARVRPAIAVVPVGARNLYGHPAPATMAALAGAVPRVYRTDRNGTVRVEVDEGGDVARVSYTRGP